MHQSFPLYGFQSVFLFSVIQCFVDNPLRMLDGLGQEILHGISTDSNLSTEQIFDFSAISITVAMLFASKCH